MTTPGPEREDLQAGWQTTPVLVGVVASCAPLLGLCSRDARSPCAARSSASSTAGRSRHRAAAAALARLASAVSWGSRTSATRSACPPATERHGGPSRIDADPRRPVRHHPCPLQAESNSGADPQRATTRSPHSSSHRLRSRRPAPGSGQSVAARRAMLATRSTVVIAPAPRSRQHPRRGSPCALRPRRSPPRPRRGRA